MWKYFQVIASAETWPHIRKASIHLSNKDSNHPCSPGEKYLRYLLNQAWRAETGFWQSLESSDMREELKNYRMCTSYRVSSQDPEKKLRGKSLSLHRLPDTLETTTGIAYNVLAYTLCFSMFRDKRVYRKGAGCLKCRTCSHNSSMKHRTAMQPAKMFFNPKCNRWCLHR